jgi:hypothetical protein
LEKRAESEASNERPKLGQKGREKDLPLHSIHGVQTAAQPGKERRVALGLGVLKNQLTQNRCPGQP